MTNYTAPILTLAAALGAGLFLITPVDAAPLPGTPAPTSADCPATLVLGVDGTKNPTTPTSLDPNSPLNPLTDAYRTQPDTAVEHIEYPGGMIAGVNGWDTNLDESVAIGADRLRSRIAAQEQTCGRTTRYVLAGFSQGAIVVSQVAREIDADRVYDDGSDLQDRVEVILVSDPGAGIASRIGAEREILPGVTIPEPSAPLANIPVHRLCHPTDLICDPAGTFIGYILNHAQDYPQTPVN